MEMLIIYWALYVEVTDICETEFHIAPGYILEANGHVADEFF